MSLLEPHALLLPAAHTDKDITFVLDAFHRSLSDMRQMVLFTS